MVKWFEIPALNLERAKQFYEEVFSIEMPEIEMPGGLKMVMFPGEDAPSGAICYHPEFYKPSKEGVTVYLNADAGMEDILKRIETGGGKIEVNKTLISKENGYMAVFEDTEGNRIALHSEK